MSRTLRGLSIASLEILPFLLVGWLLASPLLAAEYVGLGPGVELVDIGYDEVNRVVIGIGYDLFTPSLFRIDADTHAITRETIVGTGTRTQVRAISADGSRIAGVSGEGSAGLDPGVTWLTTAPGTPIPIGSVDGVSPRSSPAAAWPGGVAGRGPQNSWNSGQLFSWTPGGGPTLIDTEQRSSVRDVSLDGEILVGSSQGAAYYWDNGVTERLPGRAGTSEEWATSVSPDGTYISGVEEVIDQPGSMIVNYYRAPVIWSRDGTEGNYERRRLSFPNGERVEHGYAEGVTDSGYAVGQLLERLPNRSVADSGGFLWNAGWGGIRVFEDWLAERGVTVDPTAYPFAVSDDPLVDGLVFAVNGPTEYAIVFASKVPEPASAVLTLSVLLSAVLMKRRS